MAQDSSAGALDRVIAETSGPQPWRKVFHAINATLIASALVLLEPYPSTVPVLLGAIAAGLLTLDAARLLSPRANQLFFRVFHLVASPREARGIASSTWYMLGVLIAALLFPIPAVISGVLVLGLADPAAGYLGRRFGRRPFLGGTLEGSLVFFTASALVLGLRHGWTVAVLASVATTLAERGSWPLDDNLTIPVVCAGAVTGIGLIL